MQEEKKGNYRQTNYNTPERKSEREREREVSEMETHLNSKSPESGG